MQMCASTENLCDSAVVSAGMYWKIRWGLLNFQGLVDPRSPSKQEALSNDSMDSGLEDVGVGSGEVLCYFYDVQHAKRSD